MLTVEQISQEALALPSDARALLADLLAESLDPAEDQGIREQWIQEARRRVAQVRDGAVETIPAEEAIARVRQALGQ